MLRGGVEYLVSGYNCQDMHAAILKHIESAGFATSVHRMDDYCELHAVPVPKGEPVYISRVDADGPDDLYLAACELARICRVELE
jgi:hypothetical protein